VYALPEHAKDEADVLREWRVVSLLAKQKFKPNSPLPFSFKPKRKAELTDFFRILRDHYEESEYDLTVHGHIDSPHQTAKRTICSDSTRYSFVAQMKTGEVPELNNILWIAFSAPDANAYCPWYFSITALPEGYNRKNSESALQEHFNQPSSLFRYSSDHAYWSYALLSQKVERHYRIGIKIVQKEWQNFENYTLKMQKKKEKEFTYFLKKNRHIALKLITNYVAELEYRKWFLANELIDQLKK
jgi:dipeptidase